MPLRVGFDMDGVLADFAGAYRSVEQRLFGQPLLPSTRSPEPDPQSVALRDANAAPAAESPDPAAARQRRDAVWKAIRATPDFWTSLKPLDPRAVCRIHEMMLRKRWEVFFVTQRPATAGETVQRQTQKWLRDQGFDLPSVLVIAGSRGMAAAALRLSYHVDDQPQHCFDVAADSGAHPILIVPEADSAVEKSARTLGVTVAPSVGRALDILERAPATGAAPGLLDRIARGVGLK